jgi:hypothetical protein
MPRKSYKPEEIVAKLRQVDVLTSQGQSVSEAIRSIGVSEVTYYRWRQEFGGLKSDQVKRLKALLVPERYGDLQAVLFHIALWHLNIGYFDRNPIETWPQTHTELFCGHLRRQRMTGWLARPLRAFARFQSSVWWSRIGISGRSPWSPGF